jgi:hypothetical protein
MGARRAKIRESRYDGSLTSHGTLFRRSWFVVAANSTFISILDMYVVNLNFLMGLKTIHNDIFRYRFGYNNNYGYLEAIITIAIRDRRLARQLTNSVSQLTKQQVCIF